MQIIDRPKNYLAFFQYFNCMNQGLFYFEKWFIVILKQQKQILKL